MSTAPTPEFTDFRFHASGTYGDVYEATEVELHRKVAIKVIQVEMAHLTTAKAHGVVLAKLSHDNIVKVFRLTKVTLPGGREPVDALVMEWLTAATLSEKLRDGGMTLGEVLNIGNGVLRGLRHMHGKAVFNGDLNVGNVLIGDEFVKIIDVRAMERPTMAVYSTLSEGAKQEADIGALGGFVSMMLYRCNADTSSLLDERERLSSVKSLDEVADILEKLKQLSETGEVKKEEQSSPTKTAMDELYKLDLTKEDIQVLEVIGGMERNGRYVGEVLSTPDVTAALQKQGFPNEDIAEHIEMLQVKRFFRDNQEGYARYVRLSAFGFERYLRAFEPKYQGMINDVAVAIVKDGKLEDIAIATHLDIPRPIVMHILDAFDTNDLCSVSRSNMGYQVYDVGVRLQRNVRKMTKVQEPLSG
jgi:hypothetical protein